MPPDTTFLELLETLERQRTVARDEQERTHGGVAFALDAENQVVSPFTAPRGAVYTCLHCHEQVTLKRGKVRIPHFSHHPDSQCSASYESLEHSAFKKLLVQRSII